MITQNQLPSNLQVLGQTQPIIAASGGDTTPSAGDTKDSLSQGGVAAAVILALAVLALALMRFQRAQLESIVELVKVAKEKGK